MKTKFLLLNFLLFCFSSQDLFATNVPAGNVSGNWIVANSPYLVLGDITVPQDSLLQIDPGVVVQFQGHYQFRVSGGIHAIGTTGNFITLTALSDWGGLRYDSTSSSQDSSLFVYCNIEKGNASSTTGNESYGGAFFILNFSKIRVENCSVTNNACYIYGGAFYLDHSSPLIIGNTIDSNAANNYGGGIYCFFSSPSIINNIFSYNVGTIVCRYSSPVIMGNSITHTTINAQIFCEYSSNPSIINNTISYGSMGIYVDSSSPQIIGNVITNHSSIYGGGIRCRFSANPHITNNTIANNTASIYGGGLYADHNASPIVKNTILWGNYAPNNQGEQVALDHTSFTTFYNCDIQGGSAAIYYYDSLGIFTGTYINNLDSNPLFMDSSANNFSLQDSSPCINAGDTTGLMLPLLDLTGNQRICDNTVEIGAYEICTSSFAHWQQTPLYVTTLCLATDGTNIFAGCDGQGIRLSTDNGSSWTNVNNGLTNTTIWSLAISGTNVFAGTDAGLFLSTNNGGLWTPVNTGLTNTHIWSLAIIGANIFAGSDDGLFLSTNNGGLWNPINNGLTDLHIYELAVSGTNIFAGTGTGGVFLSVNNGGLWTAVNTGLTSTNVISLKTNGTSVFEGGSSGIAFLSVNNGSLWTPINTGLPNNNISSFAFDGSKTFAATGGGGVFLSFNSGSSWDPLNDGLPTNTYYIYEFAISGGDIFIGTNNGVWKRALSQIIGIDENQVDVSFTLFPNPFEDKLNIATKGNELAEFVLYDVTGRKTLQQSFTNSTSINTGQLAKGIYIYEVRNKKGVIKKGKVVKD